MVDLRLSRKYAETFRCRVIVTSSVPDCNDQSGLMGAFSGENWIELNYINSISVWSKQFKK